MVYKSTKILELGSCAFRQWRADSHCKFIHGYRLSAKFYFACKGLDNKNWVVDFGGLKELKNALEKQFDHTLCIAGDDPFLDDFRKLHDKGVCDLRIMPEGVGIEKTAEWCFNAADSIIRTQTNNRCWVEQVEVWEHEKNSAITSKDIYSTAESTTAFHSVRPLEQTATVVNAGLNIGTNTQTTSNAEPVPAPIGNKVSSGWSNPFGGTSWGM